MGNAQNAHLDRHGSRASSTSDVSSLGSNRHSRALDNVSLLSVDAVLTSYERRAFGELEAQAEADYSSETAGSRSRSLTSPNPQIPPDPHLLSASHQERACVSASSYSDSEHLSDLSSPHSPITDEEAARWQEWTSKSDDDGLSDDRDSIDDSDELDVNTVEAVDKESAGVSHKDIAISKDMESTDTPVLHSESMHSVPQTSSTEQVQSSPDDTSNHQETGVVKALDNKADDTVAKSGDNTVDTTLNISADDLEVFSDTVEVQSDSDALVTRTDSDLALEGQVPKVDNTVGFGGHQSDPTTDDSEDEVFSGSANDTPVSTPLARSRPVSIDDLLDCLQETPVDELELSARRKSAESVSKSPTPPPILTPPPVGHMAMFAHLDDSDMIVNAEDYPHLHEIARSEPRSEPVTDLDDDSDDEEFQQSLFKDLQSNDPEKSAAQDEMSRILMEMQEQFGMKVGDDDADSDDGSLEKERKVSRESVSSGGEYDTATMKVKRDVYSDSSDSSDDESSDSDEEKKKVQESKYDSSSEDEIIQHITPELIEKVINADDTMVDLFADAAEEPLSPAQTEDEPVTPTDILKEEPETVTTDHIPSIDSSVQKQRLDGSAQEIPAVTQNVLAENSTEPMDVTKTVDTETTTGEAETGIMLLSEVSEKEEFEGNEKDHSEKDKVNTDVGHHDKASEKDAVEESEKNSLEATEKHQVEASEKEELESSEKDQRESSTKEKLENAEKDEEDGTMKDDVESSEKDNIDTTEKVNLDASEETVPAKGVENVSSVEISSDIQVSSDRAAHSVHESLEDHSSEQGPQTVAEKDKEDNRENDKQVFDAKTEVVHEAITVEIIEPEISQNLEVEVKADMSLDNLHTGDIAELVDQVDHVPQEPDHVLGESLVDSESAPDKTVDANDTVVATPVIVVEAAKVEESLTDNTASVISEGSQVAEDLNEAANNSVKSSDDKTVVETVEENIPDIPSGACEAEVEAVQDMVSAVKVEHVLESISLNQVDNGEDSLGQTVEKTVQNDQDGENYEEVAVAREAPAVGIHHRSEPAVSESCLDDDSDIETIRVLNTQVSDCANTDSVSELQEVATDDEIVKSSEGTALESSTPIDEVQEEVMKGEKPEVKELGSSKEEEEQEGAPAKVVEVAAPEESPSKEQEVIVHGESPSKGEEVIAHGESPSKEEEVIALGESPSKEKEVIALGESPSKGEEVIAQGESPPKEQEGIALGESPSKEEQEVIALGESPSKEEQEVIALGESPSKEEEGAPVEVVGVASPGESPLAEQVTKDSEEKVSEEIEKEPEVVQEAQIISAEVTFKQQQFVFETITEDKDKNTEKVTSETKDKALIEDSLGIPEATADAKSPKKLDVIIEEDQPEMRSLQTDKDPGVEDEDDSEPPPLPTSPPPNAIPPENKEKVAVVVPDPLPPSVPEHHGYSRQLLRVISKKYPFRPMPKDPEAQRYYRQMMRQIETEIHEMIRAPEDPVRSDATRASHRVRKTSVPPPAKLTMQTPVPPPPRVQTASRPPQHPALVPTKIEPRKELSRKELKRRESETRKSKKLKKKDKENESRMAQFAQFMK